MQIGACSALVLASCAPASPTLNTSTHSDSIEVITVDDMAPLGPYSTAVTSGGVLYVSGIIAFDPDTKSFAPANIEAQTKQVFANLGRVLSAANCQLNDIMKVSVYLKNPKDFPAMNTEYARHFPDYKPARTTVPGVDWGRDDILIEIDVTAKLP